jgi:hypothetical protein
MEGVREAAQYLQNLNDDYSKLEWPRLLAWAVYAGYRHDCEQFLLGNASAESKLNRVGVSIYEVNDELAKEAPDVH